MTTPSDKYTSAQYYQDNPTWDLEDSPWKAEMVAKILGADGIKPRSICDIGCGAGFVLIALKQSYPEAELHGFDIAPALKEFWQRADREGIQFHLADFALTNTRHYDVALVLDVLEHVPDPFAFLSGIRDSADHFVFHIPLDLSAVTVAREQPLLRQRRQVGHIHYFTKNLALSLLRESGFNVVSWRYTGAGFRAPRLRLKSRVAMLPRWLARLPNQDFGVRLLGGETMLALATPNRDRP